MSQNQQFDLFCPNCSSAFGQYRNPKPDYSCESCDFVFRLNGHDEHVELTISNTFTEALNEKPYPNLFCAFCGGKNKLSPITPESRDMKCSKCSRTFSVEYF